MRHEQQYQFIFPSFPFAFAILANLELNSIGQNALHTATGEPTQIWKKSCTDIAMLSLAPSCMWMALLH